MKILVAYRQIHNTAGGVEKMSTLIMNEMAARGHSIEYVTLDHLDAISFYPLSPEIILHKLNIGDPSLPADRKIRIERIKAMRDIIKLYQPHVILAFQEAAFLSMRIAAIGLKVPVIAAERNAPSRFSFMPAHKWMLAFLSFVFARYVSIQSESFRSAYPFFLRKKLEVIPNPIFPVRITRTEKKNIIVSVGRLEYQKNFAVLIDAFSRIASKFPDWTLKIIGEGSDRADLENKIHESNLPDRVTLEGATDNLQPYFEEASIFCLPSRWEGFPNALGEAMAYGIPSVGFAECDGVNSLIRDGQTGLLATGNDNAESLSNTLDNMLADENLRKRLGLAAYQSVQSYRPTAIFDRWEKLLHKAAGEKSGQ